MPVSVAHVEARGPNEVVMRTGSAKARLIVLPREAAVRDDPKTCVTAGLVVSTESSSSTELGVAGACKRRLERRVEAASSSGASS